MFCVDNLISCAMDADDENIFLDLHFVIGAGGLRPMFELVHMFLAAKKLDAKAMERAKQAYLAQAR